MKPYLIILLIIFAACKRPSVKTEIVEKITISYRDTTIYIPGEKITDTLEVQIDCDSLGKGSIRPTKSVKSGQKTKSVIIASGNKIIQECEADSLKQTIKGLNKEIDRLKTETKIVEIEKSYIPVWVWIAFGVLLSAIGYLLVKNIFNIL
jgi:hypothetical protein